MFGKRGVSSPRKAPVQDPAIAEFDEALANSTAVEDPFNSGADTLAVEQIELEPINQSVRERQSSADLKLQEVKISVFNDLIEAVDLAQLSTLSADAVRELVAVMDGA